MTKLSGLLRLAGWRLALAGLLGLAACGGADGAMESDAPMDGDGDWAIDGDTPLDGDVAADGDAIDGDGYPDGDVPEEEPGVAMSLPLIGKDFLFILDADSGNVVLIDARALAIHTVPVGPLPTALAVLPGQDVAVLLEQGADQVVVIRASDLRAIAWPQGEGQTMRYNSLSVSPSGDFALAYFNSQLATSGIDSSTSIMKVGLIDLRDPSALSELTPPVFTYPVGINPTQVQWSPDGKRVFVIADKGVSRLDLSIPDAPAMLPPLSLGDEGGRSVDREVKITPDGKHALLRRFDTTVLVLTDLETGEQWTLDFSERPTDLDLSPDGGHAYIALRNGKRVARAPLPGGFESQEAIEWIDLPERVGLVEMSSDRDSILIYAASSSSHTLYHWRDGVLTPHVFPKGIEAVSFAPTAADGTENALVFHSKADGAILPGDDIYDVIDKSYGYTALRLSDGAQLLQLTAADQGPFTFTLDGKKGYIAITDENSIREVHILDLLGVGGAAVRVFTCASPPTSLGPIPDNRKIYVAQDHPEGRITFLDEDTDRPITITGYELNSDIE